MLRRCCTGRRQRVCSPGRARRGKTRALEPRFPGSTGGLAGPVTYLTRLRVVREQAEGTALSAGPVAHPLAAGPSADGGFFTPKERGSRPARPVPSPPAAPAPGPLRPSPTAGCRVARLPRPAANLPAPPGATRWAARGDTDLSVYQTPRPTILPAGSVAGQPPPRCSCRPAGPAQPEAMPLGNICRQSKPGLALVAVLFSCTSFSAVMPC